MSRVGFLSVPMAFFVGTWARWLIRHSHPQVGQRRLTRVQPRLLWDIKQHPAWLACPFLELNLSSDLITTCNARSPTKQHLTKMSIF